MADEDMENNESAASGEGGAVMDVEGEESGKKGFDARKVILFIVLPLLVLIGVGGGLYFTGFLDPYLNPAPAEEGEHAAPEEHAEAPAAEEHGGGGGGHGEEGASGSFIVIPPMIVNLSTEDGEDPRYLRLSVQLELKDPTKKAEVEAIIPRVVDQFQTYLRELRVQDLRGSAGIYRLQMELLWRVNQAAAPNEIKDVLFQEILIQ
ncbi:MAG: flagellar basal body-associated FliL family protein [Alphaproteobacteria bacterium]|nr:flagellar basal body-associated FliL family protein [Alphaproteobacteria bacterium]